MAEVDCYRDRRFGMFDRYQTAQKYDECRKRKSDVKLEFIVTKLKKSKCFDHHSGYKTERSAKQRYSSMICNKLAYTFDTSFCDSRRKYHRGENLPVDISHQAFVSVYQHYEKQSEYDLHSGKSKFLQQLEQKHDQQYLNTLHSFSENNETSGNKEDLGVNLKKEELDDNDDSKNDKIPETQCDKCNKRYYRKSQLIRHLSNHVVHECKDCHAVFYCVKKYKKHLETHESYPCEFCDEEFTDASLWYKHRAKHTMIECTSCEMIFYNKTALTKHKLKHLRYICPFCDIKCPNMIEWMAHRSFHGKVYTGPVLTPLLNCKECGTMFPTQEVFLAHICVYKRKSNAKGGEKENFAKVLLKDETISTNNARKKCQIYLDSQYMIEFSRKRSSQKKISRSNEDFSHLIGVDRSGFY